MKILEYQFKEGTEAGWEFDKIQASDINVLVGQTATGKTRFLNTIFNAGLVAARDTKLTSVGTWDIKFNHNDADYFWHVQSEKTSPTEVSIVNEVLKKTDGDKEEELIKRDLAGFYFKGSPIPKLSQNHSAIQLLKEEETIKPIFEGFGRIAKRYFSGDDLKKQARDEIIDTKTKELLDKAKNKKTLLFRFAIGNKLNLLQEYYPENFKRVCDAFKNVFPFVESCAITTKDRTAETLNVMADLKIKIFAVKEKGGKEWISYDQLSSGMQKVILFLADIETLPAGSIYLIDEYENSLGVNAIDFLPDYIATVNYDIQFFITSHHPYIINNFEPKDWFIFHRKGKKVSIKYGAENAKKFSKSKQEAFTQLLNDPFYAEGIE